jgi:hypothetical protein
MNSDNMEKYESELKSLQEEFSSETNSIHQIGCLLIELCRDLKEIKYLLKEKKNE